MEVFAHNASDLPKILTMVSGDCLTVDNEPILTVSSGCGIRQINHGHGSIQIGHFAAGSIHVGQNSDTGVGPLDFRVEVTLPNVCSLEISGAGDLTYQDIEQDKLRLDVSGAGTIKVTGKVNHLEADVSGAGKIAASLLSATHGRLLLSGAGTIKATVTASVVARVSGVGKIKIGGNPSQRDTDVSGLGKIKFIDSDKF